jgi:hypothetical protein
MRNFFFISAFAIPQPEGRTSATANPQLFKKVLLRNCISAYPQRQFFCSRPQHLKKMLLHNCLSTVPQLITEKSCGTAVVDCQNWNSALPPLSAKSAFFLKTYVLSINCCGAMRFK